MAFSDRTHRHLWMRRWRVSSLLLLVKYNFCIHSTTKSGRPLNIGNISNACVRIKRHITGCNNIYRHLSLILPVVSVRLYRRNSTENLRSTVAKPASMESVRLWGYQIRLARKCDQLFFVCFSVIKAYRLLAASNDGLYASLRSLMAITHDIAPYRRCIM